MDEGPCSLAFQIAGSTIPLYFSVTPQEGEESRDEDGECIREEVDDKQAGTDYDGGGCVRWLCGYLSSCGSTASLVLGN